MASSLLRLHEHTQTHHALYGCSGPVIRLTQRLVPDNTQHSQEIYIHASSGIGTHNLNKRAAADPRLRPCGHWGRRLVCVY